MAASVYACTHPFIFSLSPSNCDTSIHRCLRLSVSSGSLSVRMNLYQNSK